MNSDTSHSTFSSTDAEQISHDIFGIKGYATLMPGEYDENFHIKAENNTEFLLKISHPHEEKKIIEMQNDAFKWLSISPRPFTYPKLLHTLANESIATIHSHHGKLRFVRLFIFVPGKLFADVFNHSSELLESLGDKLGHLSLVLNGYNHLAAQRYLKWDLKQAGWIEDQLNSIQNLEDRLCVEYFLMNFKMRVLPLLPHLRKSIIHGDVNNHNILVSSSSGSQLVSGFIDFGDLVETATICELAIAIAYAILDHPYPLIAAAKIIKSYHAIFPLHENEIEILFDLICIRLCVSVVNSALRKIEKPHDVYLTISEKPAWELLRKLREIDTVSASSIFKKACLI